MDDYKEIEKEQNLLLARFVDGEWYQVLYKSKLGITHECILKYQGEGQYFSNGADLYKHPHELLWISKAIKLIWPCCNMEDV